MSFYSNFIDYCFVSIERYILVYKICNKKEFDIPLIYRFAEEKKLKVKYVTANDVVDPYEKTFASIQEWLCLIDNAEYIITNSFHASVFSIIFHKQFGVIATGDTEDKVVRFDSLFETCGIEKRYINVPDFSILDINYNDKLYDFSSSFLINKLN